MNHNHSSLTKSDLIAQGFSGFTTICELQKNIPGSEELVNEESTLSYAHPLTDPASSAQTRYAETAASSCHGRWKN